MSWGWVGGARSPSLRKQTNFTHLGKLKLIRLRMAPPHCPRAVKNNQGRSLGSPAIEWRFSDLLSAC